MDSEVSTQKLPMYSVSHRAKLTLPQAVVGKLSELFPPELQTARRANLTLFSKGPNVASRMFPVTASLQKQGEGDRVVLLEREWKDVVSGLGLNPGDTVRICLLDTMEWTYSIEVEKVPEADPIDVNAMDEDEVLEAAPVEMEFDLNEPAPEADRIDVNDVGEVEVLEAAPVRVDFDLNEAPEPDMGINPNQPNQPAARMAFDLNELPDPNM